MKDTLVITPTLGNRKSLSETIKSISKIGNSRVNHIIIAPNNKCSELKNTYPTLEIIPQPQNIKGVYSALNYVIQKNISKYKYFTYLNDDDSWSESFLDLFKILDSNANIDVVYGRVNFYKEDENFYFQQTSSKRYRAFKNLFFSNIILFTQQATLMRSNVMLKIGGYNEEFTLVADTEFWIKAIDLKFNFEYLNKVCAIYTLQSGQLSSDTTLQLFEHELLMSKLYKPNRFVLFYEKYLFRIANINIYIKRFYGC